LSKPPSGTAGGSATVSMSAALVSSPVQPPHSTNSLFFVWVQPLFGYYFSSCNVILHDYPPCGDRFYFFVIIGKVAVTPITVTLFYTLTNTVCPSSQIRSISSSVCLLRCSLFIWRLKI
jgi:hypothetical protein